MTSQDIIYDFEQLKKLLLGPFYEKDFIGVSILELLSKNFIYLTTKRTRKEFREQFSNKLERLLIHNNVADDEYFRTFRITHYDIQIDIITNDKITSLFDKEFKNFKFDNKNKFQEFHDEKWDSEIQVLFINGQLYTAPEIFQENTYLEILNQRAKIAGLWSNDSFEILFGRDYNFTIFTLKGNELSGTYYLMNDKIRMVFTNPQPNSPEELYYNYILSDTLVLHNYGRSVQLKKCDNFKYIPYPLEQVESDLPRNVQNGS